MIVLKSEKTQASQFSLEVSMYEFTYTFTYV